MYSAEQRMKAVETFARFGCSAADTIAELGYPTRHTLRNWWREYQIGGDGFLERKRREPKYSDEEKRGAVDYYLEHGCVLSSSRRQNRRYDFDTFGVSRADLFFYSRDLPSISAFSILLLAPPNSTSLPWCMMRSMMAEASLSSPNTTPHLLNSIFVVITRLRFS